MLKTRARELTLYNKTLSQLSVIHLSLLFIYIYIEDVHHTFITFSN